MCCTSSHFVALMHMCIPAQVITACSFHDLQCMHEVTTTTQGQPGQLEEVGITFYGIAHSVITPMESFLPFELPFGGWSCHGHLYGDNCLFPGFATLYVYLSTLIFMYTYTILVKGLLRVFCATLVSLASLASETSATHSISLSSTP